MAAHLHDTSEFRGARFTHADLAGLIARDCDLTGMQIVDCLLGDAVVSGDFTRLVVNDVDVTAFVQAELDRRQPERVLVRSLRTPEDHRAAWAAIERLWSGTHARLAALPEELANRRAGEEWSAAQTLRHLIFATDAWIGRTVLGRAHPYHPVGLPASGYPGDLAAGLGLELAARPAVADLLAVRAERLATVAGVVADLTGDELTRPCPDPPAPGYPENPRTVATCLRVIMNEEVEHHRYLVRDLAAVAGDAADGPGR